MRLRYWFRGILQSLAIVLGASFAYAALMLLQMDDGWEFIGTLLPLYLLLFGGIMLAAMNIATYKFNLPLALAFGSTRREAMVGLNLQRLVPTVCLIVLACVCSVSGELLPVRQLLPLGLGWFLLLNALGAVAGMIYQRFGKVVAIVSSVLLMLVGMAVGMLVAMTGRGADWLPVASAQGGKIAWAVLAVGLIVYGIILIPERRIVQSCNVKL